VLAAVAGRFEEARSRCAGYRAEMLDHPTAGRALRNYLVLTECPEWLGGLGLSEAERFWSRYYWLARFAREWQTVAGYDAGLEQQVFQLLEHAPVDYEPLPEVEAAVERDAVVPPPG
jgi:hypothetical protein